MSWVGKLFSKKKVEQPKKFNPDQPKDQKKFIAEFDGHKFYVLEANPLYCYKRFYYYIEKWEQISRLGIPNDYFLAFRDYLSELDGKRFEQAKSGLCEYLTLAVNKRGLQWYHISIAIIEAFVLVDEEDELEMTIEENRIKRKTFIDNPEARFFFINLVEQYLKTLPSDLKDMKLEDILSPLTIEPDMIENIMSHLRFINFGTLTTKKLGE